MILESLQRPQEESSIRLIFASVALGMGADLKHVRRVIHAGPPSTLESKNSIYADIHVNYTLLEHKC